MFIIGPLNRSGTNYLADVVRQLGAFQIPPGIHEDYLLVNSDKIVDYVQLTARHWSKEYRDPENAENKELVSRFGDTILDFANQKIDEGNGLLFKCPRPYNIKNVFRLFPQARVLVCLRDGRDTVESFVRSFDGYSFKEAAKLWAEGAKELLDFEDSLKSSDFESQMLRVHYEDVLQQDKAVMARLSQFLGVDSSVVPLDKIADLPLRGSSTDRGSKDELHWQPVEKPKNFNPIGRWGKWGWLKKNQFKSVANNELQRAGYVPTKGDW